MPINGLDNACLHLTIIFTLSMLSSGLYLACLRGNIVVDHYYLFDGSSFFQKIHRSRQYIIPMIIYVHRTTVLFEFFNAAQLHPHRVVTFVVREEEAMCTFLLFVVVVVCLLSCVLDLCHPWLDHESWRTMEYPF
jgi:hypothetical protein